MAQRALKARPGGEGGGALGCGVSVLEEEERHASSVPQSSVARHQGLPLNRAPDGGAVGSSGAVSNSGVGPTVGRESELEQIDATLDALAAGRSACIALDGEPGIGKTHLLTELRRRAEERGYLVLGGSATEFERDLPFSVWVDALDAYVASQELELGESWSAEQVRRARRRSSRPCAVPRRARRRAVRRRAVPRPPGRPASCSSSSRGSGRWSSCSTTSTGPTRHRSSCCVALLRRGPEAPVLLALAFRRGQAPVRLSAALATRAARLISLEPLAEAEASELLAELEPRAAAAIYRHGGGNPFYLHQLRRAGEEGRLDAAPDESGGDVAVAGDARARRRRGVAGRGARIPSRRRARAAARRGRRRGAVRAGSRSGDRRAASVGRPRRAGRLAGPRSRPSDVGAATVRLSPPPRATRGLRVRARRLEARGTRTRGSGARAARRSGGRARPPRRAVREAGRRGGDRPHARGRSRRGGEGARPRRRAGSRRRCACCPPATNGRSTCAWPSRRRCARSASSTAAGRRCSRRIDLLPADAVDAQGRADGALRRGRALARPPRGGASTPVTRLGGAPRPVDGARPRRSRSSSPWTASTSSTSRRQSRWVGVRWRRRARSAIVRSSRRPRRPSASRRRRPGTIADAEEHRREARAEVDALSDAELAPRLEALYHLAWAETYLEHYDDAVAHAERGIAIARAFGEGRLLVPLSLARNFPFEMQGRLREAIELCESALEAARLSASPHELYRALFELGWTLYYAGDLDGAIAAHEESSRVDPRLAGGTIPNGGGGPGWGLGVAWLESGEIERGRTHAARARSARTSPARCPSSAASTGRASRSPSWPSATSTRRTATPAAPSRTRRSCALQLPAALAGQGAGGGAARARRAARGGSRRARVGRGRRLGRSATSRRRSRAAWRDVRSRPAASELEAIAVLREAEQELDACGSVRVRDEMRRELRRLGARAEPRGPAAPGDSGIDALTQARARDRGPRHRSPDEPRDRRGALPQRQDDRVAPAQHLPQARGHVAGRGRTGGRARARRVRGRAGVTSLAPPVDPDAARLEELGYRQELARGLHLFDNAAMGFAGDLARRRPLRGRARRPDRGRSGVGVGPARRAGGPVPVAGRVRGAGVGVPDRRRRVPVEPPPRWAARTGGSAAGWRSAPTARRTRRSPTSVRRGPSRSSASSRRPTRSW